MGLDRHGFTDIDTVGARGGSSALPRNVLNGSRGRAKGRYDSGREGLLLTVLILPAYFSTVLIAGIYHLNRRNI